MQISKWMVVVMFVAGACLGACKSDDGEGGAGTSAGGGAGGLGGAGGAGGTTGGAGGMTGGTGGVAGAMTTGGMGGMAGGGAGGMTGGTGGGGMGGMTGGMGGGAPDGGEPDSSMGDTATFTEVYSIITMRCGGGDFGCHAMGDSGDLNMQTKMQAFMNLVGVDAEQCEDEVRVIAGDADNSLIIKALEGTAGCIDRMPYERDPLPADEIATIREWIEADALNN